MNSFVKQSILSLSLFAISILTLDTYAAEKNTEQSELSPSQIRIVDYYHKEMATLYSMLDDNKATTAPIVSQLNLYGSCYYFWEEANSDVDRDFDDATMMYAHYGYMSFALERLGLMTFKELTERLEREEKKERQNVEKLLEAESPTVAKSITIIDSNCQKMLDYAKEVEQQSRG